MSSDSSFSDLDQETGFDTGSTVIFGGFPSRVTVDRCRAFASWFSPVIHVEELPASDGGKQFAVVFATTAHVEALLKFKDITYDKEVLTVSPVTSGEYMWTSVGSLITNTNAAPIIQMAQDGLSVALNQISLNLGGYLGY